MEELRFKYEFLLKKIKSKITDKWLFQKVLLVQVA